MKLNKTMFGIRLISILVVTFFNGPSPAAIEMSHKDLIVTGTKVKGVLDRFEDQDIAVILIEELNKEILLPKSKLPGGSRESIWFNIVVIQNAYKIISIDYEKTKEEALKSADLMKRLRKE